VYCDLGLVVAVVAVVAVVVVSVGEVFAFTPRDYQPPTLPRAHRRGQGESCNTAQIASGFGAWSLTSGSVFGLIEAGTESDGNEMGAQ
jgi:hypothetical protein